MRYCICLLFIVLFAGISAQQVPYSGRHHSLSHGGYSQMVVRGYSHKGGLFRKSNVSRVHKQKKQLLLPIGKS